MKRIEWRSAAGFFVFLILVTSVPGYCFVLEEVSSRNAAETTMYIYSNVCGFEVWFDGKLIFTTPPDKDWCWFYCVSPGRHTITLKKSGCADATEVVNIVAGAENEFYIPMNCGGGGSGCEEWLHVTCNVGGYDLYVDGQYVLTEDGDGKCGVELSEGRYTVKLQKKGCSTVTKSVEIVCGRSTYLDVTMDCGGDEEELELDIWTERGCGSTYEDGEYLAVYYKASRDCYATVIEILPNGDTKTIDEGWFKGGRTYSESGTLMGPGKRIFIISAEGEEARCTIYVEEGGPKTGSIKVYVKDDSGDKLSGASVYVDGDYEGKTDSSGYLRIEDVSEGYHTVEASKSGYGDDSERVYVDAGETETVYLTLEEEGDECDFYVLVSNVSLNGKGSSIDVEPGTTIRGTLNYQVWNPSSCPACIVQIVVGLEDDPITCVYNGIPGACSPGKSGTGSFTFTAPKSEGTYYLYYRTCMQYNCSDAMSQYNKGSKTHIGTIEVRSTKPKTGSIKVYVKDDSGDKLSGASVYVDGDYEGKTDSSGYLRIEDVSEGYHTVKASKSGYGDDSERVYVDAGETETVNLTLEEEEKKILSASISMRNLHSSYALGETIEIEAFVKNTGNTFHEFIVGFTIVDSDGKEHDIFPKEILLSSGESGILTFSFEISTDYPKGRYRAIVSVWEKDAGSGRLENRLDRDDKYFTVEGEASPSALEKEIVLKRSEAYKAIYKELDLETIAERYVQEIMDWCNKKREDAMGSLAGDLEALVYIFSLTLDINSFLERAEAMSDLTLLLIKDDISSKISAIQNNLQDLASIAEDISEEDGSKAQDLKEKEKRKIDDTISKVSSLKEYIIIKETEIDEYERGFSNIEIREGEIVEIGVIEFKNLRDVESMIIEIQPKYKKSIFEFWKSNPDYAFSISVSGDEINEYEDVVLSDGKIQAYFFKTKKGVWITNHGIWQKKHSSASSVLLKIECKDIGGDSIFGKGPTETTLFSIKITIVEKKGENLKKGKELLHDILDIIERQLKKLRSII